MILSLVWNGNLFLTFSIKNKKNKKNNMCVERELEILGWRGESTAINSIHE